MSRCLTIHDSIMFHNFGFWGIVWSMDVIAEEPVARPMYDTIYVAVGNDVKTSKSTLLWAMKNSGCSKIFILHVHQPAQMIPSEFGTKFPASSVEEQLVHAHRNSERKNMNNILDDYVNFCHQRGVAAEKFYIEMDSVERGIVDLVSQFEVKKLVMGAAADKRYSRNMKLKSKKAIFAHEASPTSCHIWFLCRGHLICSREGKLDGDGRPIPHPVSPTEAMQPLKNLRSQPVPLAKDGHVGIVTNNPGYGTHKVFSFPGNARLASGPWSGFDSEGSSDECDQSRRSSMGSSIQSYSSTEPVAPSALIQYEKNMGCNGNIQSSIVSQYDEDLDLSPMTVPDGCMDDELYRQVQKSMLEAEISKKNAFEESIKLGKAEKEAMEAFPRVKTAETLYVNELRQRRGLEDLLAKERDKLENLKNQQDEIMKKLQVALDQKSIMEKQKANSDQMLKEMEEKMVSAVELFGNYKKEREQLQSEQDSALKEAEMLREQFAEESSAQLPQFSEFSFSEIREATQNFNPSFKIGGGGYGSIYRGVLRHTEVAIKMPHAEGSQGPSEYHQEVEVLSKLRHPNLVTLIGACPETWALIYEYLPNGSLEDRLTCKDDTAPLLWQIRTHIAAELCSALMFLHSIKPHGIVHADLKPSNVLLDANFVSKLSDFGICHVIPEDADLTDNSISCCETPLPKGTIPYVDPEFLATGVLTLMSDVYSFGVILLQLLTGRPAVGIIKEVRYAVDKGKLSGVLDPLAGNWPFQLAKQLAELALRCCEMNGLSRPDLASDVSGVLEAMTVSTGGPVPIPMGSYRGSRVPCHYICPIFQRVMQDPQVAADGHSYEAEAIRGWVDGGNGCSPVSGVKLAHLSLVPNRALLSAIKEWQQRL